jgi:hypothetical protein
MSVLVGHSSKLKLWYSLLCMLGCSTDCEEFCTDLLHAAGFANVNRRAADDLKKNDNLADIAASVNWSVKGDGH